MTRRGYHLVLLLAACGGRAAAPAAPSNDLAVARGCAGDAPVRVCDVDAAGVTVEADGLPASATVEVSLDVTYVHASVACLEPWTRTVVTDATGAARVRVAVPPGDDCALHDEMQAWVRVLPDGEGVASRPFVVPAR